MNTRTLKLRMTLFLGLLLLITAFSAAAAETDYANISYSGLKEFEIFNNSVEDFLQGSAPVSSIRNRLASALPDFEQIENPVTRNYLLGQLYFVLAILDEGDRSFASAVRNFERSLGYAELAVSAAPFSDGYRLMADVYTHLMKYKGMLYQFTHGMKIKQYAELALSLDENNDKARFSLALFLFNAPAIAGGDQQKSIEMFKSIQNSRALHPIDRYSVLVWLAIGYSEEGNLTLSQKNLAAALEMYPRNIWIDDLLTSYNL